MSRKSCVAYGSDFPPGGRDSGIPCGMLRPFLRNVGSVFAQDCPRFCARLFMVTVRTAGCIHFQSWA